MSALENAGAGLCGRRRRLCAIVMVTSSGNSKQLVAYHFFIAADTKTEQGFPSIDQRKCMYAEQLPP